MFKRFVIFGSLMAVFLGGLGYFQFVLKPNLIAGAMSKMKPPPATVTTEPARAETWAQAITGIGTVVASQGIDVAPQVGGIVSSVSGESGKEVAKGDVLVELDRSVERADLGSAEAILREALITYERQADLIKKKVTSEASLDAAQAKRDTADATVKKIQALIAQKTLRAPFAGRIGIRKVDVGQYVAPGTPVFSLQALDPILIDFPVPESRIGKLAVGKAVELAVDAYPGSGFRGEIETLDARVSAETRTLLVRARVPNPERKLLPGMFANVTVVVGNPQPMVTVPRTAVSYSLYGDSVYVVTDAKSAPAGSGTGAKPAAAAGPGVATPAHASTSGAVGKGGADPALQVVERRVVELGEIKGDRVAILKGVSAGEQVVTAGQLKLRPGASVRIDNTQAIQPSGARPKQ